MPPSVRLSLVGATGAVGTQFLRVIDHLDLSFSSLDLIASKRSAGSTVTFRGRALPVVAIEDYDFSKCDVSFFTAGSKVSGEYGPRAAAAGCIVVDNTSRFRLDEGIDLIVPQLNGSLVQRNRAGSIIANPNCSTIQIVKVLAPIRELFGVRDVVVSTYQAASGAGQKAVDELLAHTRSETPAPRSEYFRAPLAFNVVPVIDELYPSGWTKEELKIVHESRKIMQVPELRLTATAVRVPVVVGHSVAMFTRTERPVDVAALLDSFARNREVVACPDDRIPTPRFIAERDKTYVGRIRLDPDDPRGLWTWIVADNLWVGAAYNGGQIIQMLVEQHTGRA